MSGATNEPDPHALAVARAYLGTDAGQRPQDLVEWARVILDRYEGLLP